MSGDVQLSGNFGFKTTAELKTAMEEKKYNSFANENNHVSLFGEDGGLQAGATKDDFLSKTGQLEFDENISQSIWEVLDADGSGDISQEEYDSMLQTYGSDTKGKDSVRTKIDMASLTYTITTSASDTTEETKADSTATAPETNTDLTATNTEISSANTEEAKETEDSKKVSKSMSEIFAQNEKVKQDENGQYYITVDAWDANASENLDCTSRIIKNIYGVDYKSPEGKQILEKLVEANPKFFEKGTDLIATGAKLNLIDASEILGLNTEVKEADETSAASSAEGADATKEAKETDASKEAGAADKTAEDKTEIQAKLDEGKITGEEKTQEEFNNKLSKNFSLAIAIANGNTDYGQVIADDASDGENFIEYIQINNGSYAAQYSELNTDGTKGNFKEMYIYTSQEAVEKGTPAAYFYIGEDGKTHMKPLLTPEGTPYSQEATQKDEGEQELAAQEEEQAAAQAEEQAQLRSEIANARAAQMHAAADRWGTDEAAIDAILDNVEGQALVDVMEAYEELYGKSLESMIKGEFSFSGEDKRLQKLHDAQQEVKYANKYSDGPSLEEVSEEMVKDAQAEALLTATTARMGTDERAVGDIVDGMSDEELVALNDALIAKGKDGLYDILDSEFSGDQWKRFKARMKKAGITG